MYIIPRFEVYEFEDTYLVHPFLKELLYPLRMDTLKQLIETQKNLRGIEKEANKCRIQLIKQYQSKSNLDGLYDYLSIFKKYQEFTNKIKTETEKFEKIVSESIIPCNSKMNESMNEHNSEYNDIMTNFENCEKDSETSQDVDFSAYDGSTSFLEQPSISTTSDKTTNTINNTTNDNKQQKNTVNVDKQVIVDKEDEKEQEPQQPPSSSSTTTTSTTTSTTSSTTTTTTSSPICSPSISSIVASPKFQENDQKTNDAQKNKPTSTNNSNDNDKTKTTKTMTKKGERIGKKFKNEQKRQDITYKYDGSQFIDFFTRKNNGKPIYASTMLYCTETCNKNKKKLTEFLVKNGRFKPDTILSIIFKSAYNRSLYNNQNNKFGEYALVRVKAPLQIIKKKIKTMNKSLGENNNNNKVLDIFQSKNSNNYHNAPASTVFVYNFDVLKKGAHRALTDIFLNKFGDLQKDIQIGLDKNQSPYAIVTFKMLKDAQKLHDYVHESDKDLMFGGRKLTVSYSQYSD